MTDNEKKILSDETSELTDGQLCNATGGMNQRAEKALQARKKEKKQKQAELIADLAGAIADAGIQLGSALMQGEGIALGSPSASFRADFDKQGDEHEEYYLKKMSLYEEDETE